MRPPFLERYGLTAANGVTAVRAVLVPFIIVALIDHDYRHAFWLTVIAGASDMVDGVIARTFGHKSVIGAYLDPIADKLLIGGLFVVLTLQGHLPIWLVALAVARDAAIVVTVAAFTRSGDLSRGMKPLFISKVNTFVQLVLLMVTLGDLAFAGDWALARDAFVYGAAATTVASWLAYYLQALRVLKARDKAKA